MQGDSKVIEYLNAALRSELTAISQYVLHSRMLEDWGLNKLASHEFDEAKEEMQHADRLIKRILFLEGMPTMHELDKLRIGGNVQEVLEGDLEAEREAIRLYREAMQHCESVQDYMSRDLFGELLADEEGHHDFLETELGLIERIGLQNYQKSRMGEPGDG